MADISRRISDIDDAFQRGVCEAIYRSPDQRRKRIFVNIVLYLKHILRGLLFSWPLYLLGLAALLADELAAQWLVLLLIPAVWVSGVILWRGIREDHAKLVQDMIFGEGYLKQLVWPNDD